MASKILTLFLSAMTAAMLAGCTTQTDGPTSALGTRDLSPEEKKVVANAVGRVIKDPASAKFQWAKIPANAGTGDVNYCAKVNARSDLPGYSGNQLYIAVLGTEGGRVKSAVVGAIHGGSDTNVVRSLCKRYGLNPDDAS